MCIFPPKHKGLCFYSSHYFFFLCLPSSWCKLELGAESLLKDFLLKACVASIFSSFFSVLVLGLYIGASHSHFKSEVFKYPPWALILCYLPPCLLLLSEKHRSSLPCHFPFFLFLFSFFKKLIYFVIHKKLTETPPWQQNHFWQVISVFSISESNGHFLVFTFFDFFALFLILLTTLWKLFPWFSIIVFPVPLRIFSESLWTLLLIFKILMFSKIPLSDIFFSHSIFSPSNNVF